MKYTSIILIAFICACTSEQHPEGLSHPDPGQLPKAEEISYVLNMKNADHKLSSPRYDFGNYELSRTIGGMESDGLQIKPGVFATKQSIALYRWGRACFEMGVNTVNDAYEIFTEFNGETVSDRFKEYIRMGYYKEWEQ